MKVTKLKTDFNTKITVNSLETRIDALELKAYTVKILAKKLTFLTNCKNIYDMQLLQHKFHQYYPQIISSSMVYKP
ncbi:hypothetical protein NIES4071_48010 [Calothrix sp. NIES-4071]|nr:hypothetical protein NIES4071_48010 [Calothrix sp. NIES-4071]BAZ59113.1 hypothetical protein NIES4105_47950 [Calothrix sp. NIES-4105]